MGAKGVPAETAPVYSRTKFSVPERIGSRPGAMSTRLPRRTPGPMSRERTEGLPQETACTPCSGSRSEKVMLTMPSRDLVTSPESRLSE